MKGKKTFSLITESHVTEEMFELINKFDTVVAVHYGYYALNLDLIIYESEVEHNEKYENCF